MADGSARSSPRLPVGRLTVRAAMLLTALAALSLWSARRIWEHATPRSAIVTAQLRTLRHGDRADRIEAAQLLGQAEAGHVGRIMPQLLAGLFDPDVDLRRAAAQSLTALAQEGVPEAHVDRAAPILIGALRDDDHEVRASVALAIATIVRMPSPPGPSEGSFAPAVPILVSALDDREPMVRSAAVEALQWLLPTERGAPRRLIEATGDPSDYVQRCAIDAMARPWSNQAEVQKALVDLFRAPPEPGRADVDRDESSARAQSVLRQIGRPTDETIAALIAMVEQGPDESRRRAAYLLGQYKGWAVAALPALEASLGEVDESYYYDECVDAILSIHPASPEAGRCIDRLIEAYLNEPEANGESYLASRFQAPGILRNRAVMRLRESRESDDVKMREAADRILARLPGVVAAPSATRTMSD